MSELIKDLEYRNNFRTIILNHFKSHYHEEVWVFHPFADFYLISNTGKVKNILTNKILKSFKNANNYDCVNIRYSDGHRKCSLVHRLVCETFLGYLGINNYFYEVNHIDGNKDNNNINNLEWLTRKENLAHSKMMGLSRKFYGEENGNCRLSNADVVDIIELRKLGFTIVSIAKAYKSNRNYISNIIRGKKRNK